MVLIGKTLCSTCQEAARVAKRGVFHLDLDGEYGAEALAILAWAEAVELAQNELPILIDGMRIYQGQKAVDRLKE